MAKTEKAKQLEAKQKAERKAEKLRKKNSTNPADWPWYRQVREIFKTTKQVDSKLVPFLILAALGGIAIALILALVFHTDSWGWIFIVLLGLLMAFTFMMWVLTSRAKKSALTRNAGQAGSAQVALSMLNAKKYVSTPAIAFTRQMDMVHRVVGPCGVVLVGEGAPQRVRPLLAQERRRHEQVLFGVPVTVLVMGDNEGQVKLDQLTKTIEKLPKALQKGRQAEVNNKLRTLDAVRPKAPLPKGPMPTPKGLNRAMRGR